MGLMYRQYEGWRLLNYLVQIKQLDFLSLIQAGIMKSKNNTLMTSNKEEEDRSFIFQIYCQTGRSLLASDLSHYMLKWNHIQRVLR